MSFLFFVMVMLSKILLTDSSHQPNLILILADDLGYNDLSFRGSNEIPTPNIDALAYNGRILNRHYVLPICTPSRSALLTGMLPIRLGTQGFPLKGGQPGGIPLSYQLFPESLKALGYKTHMTGKWHVGYTSPEYLPTNRGFDSFLGYFNGYCDYYQLDYNQTLNDGYTVFAGFDMHENNRPRWDLQGQYATDIFTNRAVEIIKSHDKDKPLFLFVSHLAAHTGTDEEGDGLQPPPGVDSDKEFPHIVMKERRNYAAVVRALDESVGKIVATLAEEDILKDSVILFMADNGAASVATDMLPNFGSNWPLRGAKFTLYEGGVRGAAVLWSFNMTGGVIDDQMYHITDWADIFISFAGGQTKNKEITQIVENFQTNGEKKIPRNFLLNLDETANSEAVLLKSRWKVIKQNLRNYANYDYHFQVQAKDSPDIALDMIRESQVGRALQDLGVFQNDTFIKDLRQRTTINCKPTQVRQPGYVSPSTNFLCKDFCVFDVIHDPCELTPLFEPEILKEGKNLLEDYRKDVVPQDPHPVDDASNPALFGGVWTPWLDNEPKKLLNSANVDFFWMSVLLIVTLPRILKLFVYAVC